MRGDKVLKQHEYLCFDKFLKDSFKDDIVTRELRLSDYEVNHIQQSYPNANITILVNDKVPGKNWYEVKLQSVGITSPVLQL